MNFLNKEGLSYFWNKIKDYITSFTYSKAEINELNNNIILYVKYTEKLLEEKIECIITDINNNELSVVELKNILSKYINKNNSINLNIVIGGLTFINPNVYVSNNNYQILLSTYSTQNITITAETFFDICVNTEIYLSYRYNNFTKYKVSKEISTSFNKALFLICDITDIQSGDYKEYGFNGVIEYNRGGVVNVNYTYITAVHNYNKGSFRLYTSNNYFIPCVCTYNDRQYLAIAQTIASGTSNLNGYFYNCVNDNITILKTDSNTLINNILPNVENVTYEYTDQIQLYYPFNTSYAETLNGYKSNGITFYKYTSTFNEFVEDEDGYKYIKILLNTKYFQTNDILRLICHGDNSWQELILYTGAPPNNSNYWGHCTRYNVGHTYGIYKMSTKDNTNSYFIFKFKPSILDVTIQSTVSTLTLSSADYSDITFFNVPDCGLFGKSIQAEKFIGNIDNALNATNANSIILNKLTDADLNDIKPINYTVYYMDAYNKCINVPTDVIGITGYLHVNRLSNTYVTQVFYHTVGNIFTRTCINGIWGSWQRMITETDLHPLIERIELLESKL